MELAIALLIGVITGFLMGRQNTKDKVSIETTGDIKPLVKMPTKEIEPSAFELGLDNILNYDGTDQRGNK